MDIHIILFLVFLHSGLSFAWYPLEVAWDRWIKTHGFHLGRESFRKAEWTKNMVFVDGHNKQFLDGNSLFTVDLNEMAALTDKEYSFKLGAKMTVPNARKSRKRRQRKLRVDYRKRGFVTRVKNQGSCGSCWAFSTTGSIEGQLFKKTRKLISLSEQNLVDCSRTQTYGCNGGWMGGAMEFVKEKGILSEAHYPYTGRDDDCRHDENKVVTKIKGYVRLPTNDERALGKALKKVGPITIAVDAGKASFRFYRSGIYNDPACSSKNLNHAVLLVGAGSKKGVNYWIIKNSWGTGWGENGYMRMIRDGTNTCGIASYALYPKL